MVESDTTKDLPTGPSKAVDGLVLGHDQVLAQLMQSAQIGVWRYDPDTDIYYFSNELDLGYEGGAAVTPRSVLKMVQHPADGPKDDEIRERLTRFGGEAETEMRYRHADQTWIHLRVHYRSGRQLPSGRYEMYGLSQNITPQAEARDRADEAATKARLALKAANAGVFQYDYKTETYAVSDELTRLIGPKGLQRGEGNPLGLFHPADREKVSIFGLTAASGKGARPVDARLYGSRGYFWVRLFMEVEHGPDGLPCRGVGLMLDVDTQKRQAIALEKARKVAEEATEAKSTFLASVSHEIRTPLNGVTGMLHLLQRQELPQEARELVREALSSGEMLGQLINDILDFSKIEAGKLELSPVPTNLHDIVTSVSAMLRPVAEAKDLWLRLEMPQSPGWAMIDPVRLRQCLFNVTGNAVKFTRSGGVTIRLLPSGTAGSQRLRFEIQDTGIGIPEEAKGRLFERFQQAESGTTRKFGGTGLGLAISRSLSRMMGGDMGFDSVLGEGSTFWFEIAAPACEAGSDEPELAGADSPLEGLRFLVVDDNATNRLVASKTLEAMGAEAVCVDSGPAAVEAVSGSDYDLVLMDINMPDMDGMEATRLIRALGGAAAEIPVIALTADVMKHQQARYLAAGMNGVAPKPFSPGQLLAEIARLMQDDPGQDSDQTIGSASL